MKKTITAFVALACLLFSTDLMAQQCWKWGTQSGTTTHKGFTEVAALAVDNQGNSFEILWSGGATSPGPVTCTYGPFSITNPDATSRQASLICVDSNGSYKWAIGTQAGDVVFDCLTTDPFGDVYVAGSSSTGFAFGTQTASFGGFVIKIDSGGNVLWIKNPNFEYVTCMQTDKDGALYLAGGFTAGSITIGTTVITNASTGAGFGYDALYAKYDSSCNPVWAKSFGGTGAEFCKALAVANNKEVYLGGNCYYANYVSSGTTYTQDTMTIGGTTFRTGNKPSNCFFAKADSNGNVLWGHVIANDSMDVEAAATDRRGNVYFTGAYSDTLVFGPNRLNPATTGYFKWGMYCARFDSSGNAKWARTFADFALGYSISVDSAYHIWACGARVSEDFTKDPMFIAKYDTSGTLKDTLLLNSGGDDYSTIAVDNRGNFYLGADYLVSPFRYGDSTWILTDSAQELSFVLKYDYACARDLSAVGKVPANVDDINIFPNPASYEFEIASDQIFEPGSTISIFDMSGRIIKMCGLSGNKIVVPVSDLHAGVYECQVSRPGKVMQQKKLVIMQ